MLEKFIEEVKDLQGYKTKCEYLEKDKIEMSKLLYKYMIEDYERKTKSERIENFKNEWCRCCRNRNDDCNLYPENVGEPIWEEGYNWIPARCGCSSFIWR